MCCSLFIVRCLLFDFSSVVNCLWWLWVVGGCVLLVVCCVLLVVFCVLCVGCWLLVVVCCVLVVICCL